MERIFGHISGYPEGSWFASRIDLSKAGVHRPRRAGISGNGREGADSVVLAGRYEETGDFGGEILYTGHGGREPETGQQVGHQALTRGNLALATSRVLGLPVRVIRGAGSPPPTLLRSAIVTMDSTRLKITGKSKDDQAFFSGGFVC